MTLAWASSTYCRLHLPQGCLSTVFSLADRRRDSFLVGERQVGARSLDDLNFINKTYTRQEEGGGGGEFALPANDSSFAAAKWIESLQCRAHFSPTPANTVSMHFNYHWLLWVALFRRQQANRVIINWSQTRTDGRGECECTWAKTFFVSFLSKTPLYGPFFSSFYSNFHPRAEATR